MTIDKNERANVLPRPSQALLQGDRADAAEPEKRQQGRGPGDVQGPSRSGPLQITAHPTDISTFEALAMYADTSMIYLPARILSRAQWL